MSEHQTPRIDGSLLSNYTNRTVRIIGRIESVSTSTRQAVFYTPSSNANDLKVNLVISQDLEEFEEGVWYEIIGRVLEDELKVSVIDVKNFGNDIDEKAVAGLVKYSGKASEIFHD